MKTFKNLLLDLAEKETDAEYNKRMRKTAISLKRVSRKSSTQKIKTRNSIKRRSDDKLDTAAKQKAKRIVLKSLPDKMRPSAKRDKVAQKAAVIDRVAKKLKKDLKRAEPARVKQAKASKIKKVKK